MPVLFQLMDHTGVDFSNDIQNTTDLNIFSYRNFYNGGGAAIGDINNDGLADIFFTANMGANKLYLNKGNFQFQDISENAGFTQKKDWSTGVVMVDINGDGWLDIYVCNAGYINGISPQNRLFINNHNLTFSDSTAAYGLDNKGGYCTHTAFFDFDLDGDLDAYILNNSFIPVNTLDYSNKRDLRAKDWPVKDFLKGGGDKLLRNDDGKFVDISEQAGIYGSLIGFGLGVTVGDVNGDNYPDIYVSNDFFERDYLYLNQQDGTYKEQLEQWMQHISHSSMGADIGDINNDGYPDIFTTDMLPSDEYRLKTSTSFENIDVNKLKVNSGFYNQFMQNALQVNNRNGKFMETGYYSGIAASDWSWGALMFDADNDGLSDIYVCNGINHDVTDQDFIDFFANDIIQKMVLTGNKENVDDIINKMPSNPIVNKFFKNEGHLRFSDSGAKYGITEPSFSNGAAYGDLDNDGDLDLIVNNVNEPAFIYKNNAIESGSNNYIGFSLTGSAKNTFAIGTHIKVYQGSQIFSREIMPSRGFQSSVDYKQIIGLGKAKVDSVIVIWPDKSVTLIDTPSVNKVIKLAQSNGTQKLATIIPAHVLSTFLTPVKSSFGKHTEDDYTDFYFERNIPVMLSREGPSAACGDVNGDGLADVFITGAAKQAGQLYLQNNSGAFIKKEEKGFLDFADFEDVTALFFDCDKDGDLDLLVGSGGNNVLPKSREIQNRLYKNDGKGNFTIDAYALPANTDNTGVVAANDFDNDGDTDLFIGGRCISNNYGLSPVSYILMNDGTGKFKDIAATKNKDIATIGMVTGAVWANITGDQQKELIITGEWMAPRIFSFKKDHFVEVTSNLSRLLGWWKTMEAADLDGDGDQDLVLGNIGENFYLHPDSLHPVKMFINDFDGNGTIEKILTRTIDGKDMPVFLKRDITDQIPSLKKQNLKHRDYAKKSIQDLFPEDMMKKCMVKQFNYNSSCIAVNNGNGNFSVKKLPLEAELSSVNALLCIDINGDGFKDIIAGGNEFDFLPQFCRIDASFGSVLLNDGKANFIAVNTAISGLELRGQIRDIQAIQQKNITVLLFLQNNEYPSLYKLSGSVKKQ